MTAALMFSLATDPLVGRLGALVAWTMTMCFTWPALEAIISEDEDDHSLPRMIGLYNVTWAGSAGLAYLVGGALFETLGQKSIYWFPAILHGTQIMLVRWLEKQPATPHEHHDHAHHVPEPAAFQQPVKPETFLKMAWLANPFAYIAINTILAVIPSLAQRLELSTAQTGLFCSLWFFTRLGAFFFLWHWTGWHYQFRWLLLAFVGLIAGFATLLLAHELWLLIVAQVIFGVSTGLIYYSSLFYSMDVGEDSQGEHGGVHEAAIGLGIFLGPAIGAAGIYFAPGNPNASTWAVSALLLVGLAALLRLRFKPTLPGRR
jgi:MFS family permease